MQDDKIDISLTPQFSATVKAGISAQVAGTWDADLPRIPRLLVPVDLRALVVADNPVEHAAVGVRIYEDPEYPVAEGERRPEPFTDVPEGLARGVHLHWAMPDGLTQGRVVEPPEDDLEDEENSLELRRLPNRWLVMRVEAGTQRVVRAWVLEAERAAHHDLEGWVEPGPPPEDDGPATVIRPEELTAIAGGDVAWAAVYDNVVDRFAFHDDLADLQRFDLPLTYVVVGWYSDPELDPLFLRDTTATFAQAMSALGWTFDDPHVSTAMTDAVARSVAATTLGLRSALLLPFVDRPDGRVEIPDLVLDAAASDPIEKQEPWWPRQSLYHGTIYGVAPDGVGADERPDATAVASAIAPGAVEGLAALLAAGVDGDRALAERLQTAFGYGLIEALDEPDGPARLDEEMHARAFGSLPGEKITEFVRTGDPFFDLRLPPEERIHAALFADDQLEGSLVSFEFATGSRRRALEMLLAKRELAEPAPSPDAPGHGRVDRSLPRFYHPTDPVLVIRGLDRSMRHGYDGVWEPDEKLHCRISGNEVKSQGTVRGADVLAAPLDHGGIPRECEELLREAVLNDPFGTDDLATVATSLTGLPLEAVSARLGAERQLFLHAVGRVGDVAHLLPTSMREGTDPSPVAITRWRQAWVPLYLEWEIDLELEDPVRGWTLGEIDLDRQDPSVEGRAVRVSGRSLLTSSVSKNLVHRVIDVLQEEERLGEAGAIEPSDEDSLRRLVQGVRDSDIVSAALEGLRMWMLGFDTDVVFEELGDEKLTPERPPRLLRAGRFRFRRARVVDAFGRVLDLDPEPTASEAIGSDDVGAYLLRPRINAPARLLLRFLDGRLSSPPEAGSDGRPFRGEASVDQRPDHASVGPIAGWLLPDHVDGALEVFDAAGEPLGQVLHDPISGALLWEGAPGSPWPLGASPEEMIPNPSVAALVAALVRRDAADRAGRGPDERESCLSALLRMIDTTRWTIDPFGSSGPEYLSMLVGRPIAIVRAAIGLEVQDDSDEYDLGTDARDQRAEAFRRLAGRRFDVRLGALSRSQDGLLAYFVDDDYTRCRPVHPLVLEQAVRSGPRTGYLGSLQEASDFHADPEGQTTAIDHPYLSKRPTLEVSGATPRSLTLLMVPDASVHVTSGILPRKSLSLVREWIDEPLARILPSLRVGPVLVDPETIRMPKPVHLGEEQMWSRRASETTWRHDPIVAATQEALFPKGSAVAQEGYIRIRGKDE